MSTKTGASTCGRLARTPHSGLPAEALTDAQDDGRQQVFPSAVFPFHVRGVHFRVLDRNGEPAMPHEQGLKDTVLVDPGSTVRVITEFADLADPKHPYLYHCHNLEHEDAGMMGQFAVV